MADQLSKAGILKKHVSFLKIAQIDNGILWTLGLDLKSRFGATIRNNLFRKMTNNKYSHLCYKKLPQV